MKQKATTNTDTTIGLHLRDYRHAAGLTMGELAVQIGVTSQQLAKYEDSSNRIAASRLEKAAEVLQIPIQDFFDAKKIEPDVIIKDRARMTLMGYFDKMDDKMQKIKLVEFKHYADLTSE